MDTITLEKIDIVKERTGVSYTDAKEALEECDGDVVNALIYIEAKQKNENKFKMDGMYTTKEEFLTWIKDTIKKGNVTRIKVKKGETIIMDIPVNGGIAVGIVGYYMMPGLLALGVFAAVITKVTIEITKADGTVEVVNTIIKNTVEDVKGKMNNMTEEVKEKFNETKDSFNKGYKDSKENKDTNNENVYQYTVKFEEKEKQEQAEKAEKEAENKEQK